MFTTKKKTLIEDATQLVEESREIKSVFVKMKTDLENKNVALGDKASEIEDAIKALKDAQQTIGEEAESNDSTIKNIDKILK